MANRDIAVVGVLGRNERMTDFRHQDRNSIAPDSAISSFQELMICALVLTGRVVVYRKQNVFRFGHGSVIQL